MVPLSSVYERFSLDALSGDELDSYYVDAFEGRGGNPIKSLKRQLLNKPGGDLQILFSGYRGCGKSTELNKLQREISDDFVVLNFSVLKELDPVNLNYVELFVITMEKLFDVVSQYNIRINPQLFKSVSEWSRSAEIEEIRLLTGEASLETGVKAEVSVPLFARFFGKMRAAANASFSTKKRIIESIEPRLSDLVGHCNDLIREVKSKLPDIDKKGLIIIIEDLDKLSIEKAEELFFNHSNIITSFQTHVIFTVSVIFRYHPKFKLIKEDFDEDFELPMIKVRDKHGELYSAGRNVLLDIIKYRIGTECFEPPELVYEFIDKSGGCLRDLFRMIRDAADNALNHDKTLITQNDYLKSFYRLRHDYENTIAEKRVNNQLITSVEEYYNILNAVALSETKKLDNTSNTFDLRQSYCVISYDSEGWCDLHPAVHSILQERNMIPGPDESRIE